MHKLYVSAFDTFAVRKIKIPIGDYRLKNCVKYSLNLLYVKYEVLGGLGITHLESSDKSSCLKNDLQLSLFE
jgi:hypothetical protein